MPRVQAYGERRVDTRPVPAARLTVERSPASFGAGALDQVARVATTFVGQMWERERAAADQLAVLKADRQVSEWKNRRMYDPDQGILTVKGEEAMQLPDSVLPEFESIVGAAGATLKNDRQRQAFARIREQHRESLDYALHSHIFKERQQFDADETKASLEAAYEDAAASASNETLSPGARVTVISRALQKAEAIVNDHADRNGLGPAMREMQLGAARTAVHVGVIDRLLASGKDQAAKVYYEETQEAIGADARTRIEKALQEGTIRGESQRAHDRIMESARSLPEAVRQARAIEDPTIRDSVEQRVQESFRIQRQAQNDAQNNIMIEAANIIDKAGTVRAVPPSMITQLEPGQRATLEAYAERNVTGIKTDMRTWFSLMDLAQKDPTRFLNTNLVGYIDRIGKQDLEELKRLQLSLSKGVTPKQIDEFGTETQLYDDLLREFGIKPKSEAAYQLREQLQTAWRTRQEESGKKPSFQELRQIADDTFSRVVLKRGSPWSFLPRGAPLFDKTKLAKDVTIADVPARERQEIMTALGRSGLPVTEQNVIKYYIRDLVKRGEVKRR